MRAATEGNLPPVMPQGNLVEVLGREVRQGSPGELMVESSPSRQRRPPCKTNKEMSDEAADAAALTYLLTYLCTTPLVAMRPRSVSPMLPRGVPGHLVRVVLCAPWRVPPALRSPGFVAPSCCFVPPWCPCGCAVQLWLGPVGFLGP